MDKRKDRGQPTGGTLYRNNKRGKEEEIGDNSIKNKPNKEIEVYPLPTHCRRVFETTHALPSSQVVGDIAQITAIANVDSAHRSSMKSKNKTFEVREEVKALTKNHSPTWTRQPSPYHRC